MAKPTQPIVIENIPTFRRQQAPNEICVVPEIPQNRKTTDVGFIFSFGISILLLIALMIYALVKSDMQRFIHGYDACGNVCGSKNSDIVGVTNCSGFDMTDKPFLEYHYGYTGDECVAKCETNSVRFHRCLPYDAYLDDEFWPVLLEKIQDESVSLTILCFIGLGLSIVALIVFRFFVKQFVWTMLILSILMVFAVAGLMWYLYTQTDSNSTEDDKTGFLALGILFTIVAVIFALCILFLITKIKMIIFFYEESVKIVFAMPLILIEPVLTFVSNFVIMALFVYIFLLMLTSGNLQSTVEGFKYVPDGAIYFVLCWSWIMTIWLLFFVLACQQIVISGAVATYYFARDKLLVVSPVYNSFYNLVRYHIGTAAFGSLVLTLITILKGLVRAASNQNNWLRLLYFCLRPIENLVHYMTSMGYIETAIHGQPLCRSSIRALNLIVSNLLSAVALNSVGNLVFFMAKLVVVAITVLVGVLMELSAVTIVFGGLVALMCIHCFLVVFEVAVDTVFICYCEDQCINDGDINPYYASMELHNEIKKAQQIALKELQKQEKKNVKSSNKSNVAH